jgi:hypothetical protein
MGITKRFGMLLLGAVISVAVAAPADAFCTGSETISTCTDSSGNDYTINRLGNMTYMNGYNAQTGSRWNETVNHFGSTTTYEGMTNGQSWHMNQFDYGNGFRSYNATNAAGRPFSYTCAPYSGCN